MERLQSKVKVPVGNIVFGGEKLIECVNVISTSTDELIKDLKTICAVKPDLIEWRVDYFDRVTEPESVVAALQAAAKVVGDIPILFTFRALNEGGYKHYDDSVRERAIKAVTDTGLIGAVDIELTCEAGFRGRITDYVHARGVKLILSFHDCDKTPSVEEIMLRLKQEQELHADIAKVSVKPNSFGDVLTLMTASRRSRLEQVDIPQITVSKDDLGVVTRIFGACCGSDLSFLKVVGASTPGQLSVQEYRDACRMLLD